MKGKTKVECSFDIAKNTFDSKKVICNKGMQKLIDRIDSIGNILTRNGQVVKGINKRSMESRIRERRTISIQVLITNHGVWTVLLSCS